MTEQQQHLKNAIHQQRIYVSELAQLEQLLVSRKEQVNKLQGIIEYLVSLKVELPQEELDSIPTIEQLSENSIT